MVRQKETQSYLGWEGKGKEKKKKKKRKKGRRREVQVECLFYSYLFSKNRAGPCVSVEYLNTGKSCAYRGYLPFNCVTCDLNTCYGGASGKRDVHM